MDFKIYSENSCNISSLGNQFDFVLNGEGIHTTLGFLLSGCADLPFFGRPGCVWWLVRACIIDLALVDADEVGLWLSGRFDGGVVLLGWPELVSLGF